MRRMWNASQNCDHILSATFGDAEEPVRLGASAVSDITEDWTKQMSAFATDDTGSRSPRRKPSDQNQLKAGEDFGSLRVSLQSCPWHLRQLFARLSPAEYGAVLKLMEAAFRRINFRVFRVAESVPDGFRS